MKDFILPKGTITQVNSSKKHKQSDSLREIQRELNEILHVPFYDDCCPKASSMPFPTGFDITDQVEKYFDPETKTWTALPAIIPTPTNTLYSSDDSLTGNRIVTGATHNLTFTGIGAYTVNGTSIVLNSSQIQFPTGAANGKVWTSDASGFGTWTTLTVPPSSYFEVTKTQLDTAITGSTLVKGATYKVSGVHPTLYNDGTTSGTTIFVQATDVNTISSNGIGMFYNPKYTTSAVWNPYSSVVTSSTPTATIRAGETITANNGATGTLLTGYSNNKLTFLVTSAAGSWTGATSYTTGTSGATGTISSVTQKAYSIGAKVSYGGYIWSNVNGNLGAASTVLALNSEWSKVAYNTTDYNLVYDPIVYDYTTNAILGRREVIYNNTVQYSAADLTYFVSKSLVGTPISVFGWGSSIRQGNIVNSGYFECVNIYGENYQNSVFEQSIIAGNNQSSDSGIDKNLLRNRSEIRNNLLWDVAFIISNTMDYQCQINSNKFWNTLQIDNNILGRICMINSNEGRLSWIYDNVLRNGSTITSNLLVSNCFIYKNVMASSNINSNNLNGVYVQAVGSDQAYIFANTMNYATINSNNLNVGSNGRRVYICNNNLVGDTSQDTPIRLASINGNTIASLAADSNAYIRSCNLTLGQILNANIQGGSHSLIDLKVDDYIWDFSSTTAQGGLRGASARLNSMEVTFSKTFTGAAGVGQVGNLVVPLAYAQAGYFIDEVLVDVGAGLTSAGAAIINLGFATDAPQAALNDTTGLVTTLNTNGITKISASTFTKATTTRALIAQVKVADITAGTMTVMLKFKKLN